MKPKRFLFAPEGDPPSGGGGTPPPTPPTPPAGDPPGTPPPVTPPAGTPPPVSRPDWAPEKFWKGDKLDGETLVKSYKELESKLGKMQPPGEVPADPSGYDLKPDKLPDGIVFSEAAAAEFAKVFHAKGVSKEAAKDIAKTFMELEAKNHADLAAAYEKTIADGTAELKKQWGGEYDLKLGKVKSVVASLGYDANDASLFSNPKVVSFLGKVVGMLSEDSVASMRGAVAPGNAFVNGTEEANAIMRDAKHPDHAAYMAGDRTIIAKVKRLIDG